MKNVVLSVSQPLAENGKNLLHEDSHQPAAKVALVFEPRRIPRCSQPAVFERIAGSFQTAQNSSGDDVEQPVAAPESGTK